MLYGHREDDLWPQTPCLQYGITGRHIFATWYKAARFLQSGLLDPSLIITHRFPLGEFDQAMDLIAHGDCGKVLLLP